MSAPLFGQSRPASQPTSDNPRDVLRGFEKEYALVSEQNIFLKERQKRQPASRPVTSRPSLPPEANFTLIGIVLEGDEIRAYIEDRAAGSAAKLAVGEPVGRGTIAEIEIDAVGFVMNGQHHWIELGQDFTGKQVEAVPVVSSAPPPSAGSSSPGNVPGEAGLSVEERMRRRAAAARGGGR